VVRRRVGNTMALRLVGPTWTRSVKSWVEAQNFTAGAQLWLHGKDDEPEAGWSRQNRRVVAQHPGFQSRDQCISARASPRCCAFAECRASNVGIGTPTRHDPPDGIVGPPLTCSRAMRIATAGYQLRKSSRSGHRALAGAEEVFRASTDRRARALGMDRVITARSRLKTNPGKLPFKGRPGVPRPAKRPCTG